MQFICDLQANLLLFRQSLTRRNQVLWSILQSVWQTACDTSRRLFNTGTLQVWWRSHALCSFVYAAKFSLYLCVLSSLVAAKSKEQLDIYCNFWQQRFGGRRLPKWRADSFWEALPNSRLVLFFIFPPKLYLFATWAGSLASMSRSAPDLPPAFFPSPAAQGPPGALQSRQGCSHSRRQGNLGLV